MCGIVGYIGAKDPVTVLIEGLRKLEGHLEGFEDNHVLVVVDGAVNRVPYANVARARVLPQY